MRNDNNESHLYWEYSYTVEQSKMLTATTIEFACSSSHWGIFGFPQSIQGHSSCNVSTHKALGVHSTCIVNIVDCNILCIHSDHPILKWNIPSLWALNYIPYCDLSTLSHCTRKHTCFIGSLRVIPAGDTLIVDCLDTVCKHIAPPSIDSHHTK